MNVRDKTEAEAIRPGDSAMRDATSLVELGRQLLDDASHLVRAEIQLAKEEVKELAVTNLKGVALLLIAAVVALVALIMLQVAIIFTLPPNIQFIVAWALFGFWFILVIVFALMGKARFRFKPPEKTIETIKGDLEWAKGQMRSNGR